MERERETVEEKPDIESKGETDKRGEVDKEDDRYRPKIEMTNSR